MNTTKRKIITNDGDNCTIHVDETCTLPVYDWNDFDNWTNADWKFIFGAMVSTPVTYVMCKETDGGLYYINYFDDAEIQFNDVFAFTNVASANNLTYTSCLIHECINPMHPNYVPLLHSAWHQWGGV